MNLSDHSKSIHQNIQKIENSIKKLGEITGTWINDLVKFFDPSPLWRRNLKMGFYILMILVVLLLIIPCILLCVRRVMDRVAKEVFLVQTEGGDVGTLHITPDVRSPPRPRREPKPRQGARRSWHDAQNTWWLDFDPANELPVWYEGWKVSQV